MAFIPKDTTVEILLNLSVKEILQKCRINKQYESICQDDRFWRRYAQEKMRLKEKPEMVETWKDFVLIRTRMSPYKHTYRFDDDPWDMRLILPKILTDNYLEILLGKKNDPDISRQKWNLKESDVFLNIYDHRYEETGNVTMIACFAKTKEKATKHLIKFYLLICRLAMYVMDITLEDVIHTDLYDDIIIEICENKECNFLCPENQLKKIIKEKGMEYSYPNAIMQLKAHSNFERWYRIEKLTSKDAEVLDIRDRKIQDDITITEDILKRLIGLQERDVTVKLPEDAYHISLSERGFRNFTYVHRVVYDKKDGKLHVTSWYPYVDELKKNSVIQGFWNRFSKRLFLYE